uniref:DUF834 domain-containing protein n=1 Tax=Oryza sativa subsp. japonica TaxID=39947 RepID=Q2QSX1_ORYSJ|nr:hypothetical protein LOC_Os12g22640 [Oryza sativa Japonica Group]
MAGGDGGDGAHRRARETGLRRDSGEEEGNAEERCYGWPRRSLGWLRAAANGDQRRRMRRRHRVRGGGGDLVVDWGNGGKTGVRRGVAMLVVQMARHGDGGSGGGGRQMVAGERR